MNKKLMSLMVILVLTVTTVAYAALPSVDTTLAVSAVTTENGTPSTTEVTVQPISVSQAEEEIALLESIAAFEETAPVMSYFTEEVLAEAAEILPEGVNLDDLKLDEFVSLSVKNYSSEEGSVTITLTSITTKYEDGANLLAMVGILNGADTVWKPVKAEAVDGQVKITLSAELLTSINAGKAVLAVFSEKKA